MILVTGGAKGLGKAIVLELARRKHDVVIHYRKSQESAESVAEECRSLGVKAHIFQGDFSLPETTDDFIHRYEKKGIATKGIVNNVGEYFEASLEETPLLKWRHLFECNLHAPYALIMALLPLLKREKGRVVNIGVAGLNAQRAHLRSPAYRIAKGALASMTASLGKELAPDGVTVNMVSPGYLENSVDMPDLSALPMGRPATLKEMAIIVASFFDKEYSYVTGQNLEVSGGYSL